MTATHASRLALALLFVAASLFGPTFPAAADEDDDQELKARLRAFRCYRTDSSTIGRYWVEMEGRENATVHFMEVLALTQPGSQPPIVQQNNSDSIALPGITGVGFSRAGQFDSLALGVAGLDERNGEAFHVTDRTDCERIGGRQEIEVVTDLYCFRSKDGFRSLNGELLAFAQTWLLNHGSQRVDVRGQTRLLGRFQGGGGDFQELDSGAVNEILEVHDMNRRTLNLTAAGDDRLRRVRAEVELQLPGRDRPLRESKEVACPGDD